jgi:tetratricopeptide (TPR) repeat protein
VGDRVAAIQQFNAGSEAANKARIEGGDWQLAYQLHSSSVMNDDTFGVGWHELGNDLADMQHSAAALAAFRRSIELPDGNIPGDMTPALRAKSLVQMAYRLYVLGHLEEAVAVIGRAKKLDASSPQAWCVSSLIHSIDGNHEAAEADASYGLSLDPGNATIETALGLNLLFGGKFQKGLKHFEARFRYKLKHFLSFPYPQWHGETGKRVYLVADQGLGDTLSFARFLRQAASRSKFMFVGVQKELIRLFKASFQDVPNIEIITPNATGWPPCDAWTTFVSLPAALDLSEDEIRRMPGIAIPQFFAVSQVWKQPKDRRYHIGVAWRGSKLSDIDHHRSFAVENLLRLYEIPGVQLYSLQADAAGDELHAAGCAALIRDLRPFIGDVADTTAILRDLDMVVTVESALGHIAGACGTPTIIPYSNLGHDYRIGRDGENIIWYPKHSIVKQLPDEPWHRTFARVVEAVRWRAYG